MSSKGSLILLNLFSLFILLQVIEDEEFALKYMVNMIYVQRLDNTYDSVNFDDPISTLSYFKKLFQSFSRSSDKEIDILFKELVRRLKTRSDSESVEAEAQRIMRSAAEKIHGAFRDLKHDSITDTTAFVHLAFVEAFEGLIDLVPDREDDDDDGGTRYPFQLSRNHTKKDAGGLKDYDALGENGKVRRA
jgi:hypothetical protein